jgi:CRP-like cAMP-binding protein
MISEEILTRYHARLVSLDKGDFIFREGETAADFFIVRQGHVKMGNLSEDGKEFVQGYFTNGQSFGEPPFFAEVPYPAFAVAVTAGEVWRIGRAHFLKLLRDHFEIHLEITKTLGTRLIYKSIMLSEIAIEEAEHRVRTLVMYIRETMGDNDAPYTIPFSRQQLADMSGLRVETVIRTVKILEQKGVLTISSQGKIVIS